MNIFIWSVNKSRMVKLKFIYKCIWNFKMTFLFIYEISSYWTILYQMFHTNHDINLFCFFILLQFLIADFYYLSPNDKYIHISFDCPSSPNWKLSNWILGNPNVFWFDFYANDKNCIGPQTRSNKIRSVQVRQQHTVVRQV